MGTLKYVTAIGLVVAAAGCAHTPVQRGAVGGGLVGATIGAIAGGEAADGALIGAGIGALTGAIAGDVVAHDRAHRGRPYRTYPHDAYVPAPPPPVYRERVIVRDRPSHFSRSYRVEDGHFETRLVRGPSGEYYEERVWVPER